MFQMLGRWRPSPVQHLAMLALSAWIFAPFSYRILAADSSSQSPVHTANTTKKSKAERPPFDLTYVPSDANGVLAIRPSAIFADPAMKPLAGIANQGLGQLRQFLKLSAEPKLAIEDIEEIIAPFTIKVGDKKHSGSHSLLAGLSMIRTTHDFDWLKLMRQLDPKLEEVRHEGRPYYLSHYSHLIPGVSPKVTFGFFMPDNRTLAFTQKETFAAFVKGQDFQRPHFAWDTDWKRIEYGLIAVAIDNRWANGLSKEEIGGVDPISNSIAQNAATVVAGLDWKNGIDFHAFLTGRDRAAGDQIVKDIKTLIAGLQDVPQEDLKDASENMRKATAFHLEMCKDLAKHAHIRQGETTVRVHTTAKIKLADLAKYLFSEPTPIVIEPRK